MSFSKLEVGVIAGFLLLIAFLASANERRLQGDLSLARHDASTARAQFRAADSYAQLLTASAAAAERRADSLEHLPTKVRYRTLAAAAPDTCRVVVQAANAALDEAAEASQSLHEALDSSKVAVSVIRAPARQLEAATATLERASKPSLLRALIPRPQLGAYVGVDQAGKPHLIAGVGFGWSL